MTGSAQPDRPGQVGRTPDPSAPRVSVILVSYNTRDRLMAALDALGRAGEEDLEVVVVDNASTDGSAAAARDHPVRPAVIERAVNGGFSAGVNSGLAAARGRILLLVNSDAVVSPGGLSRLADYLEAHPDVGVAGGRVLNGDGSLQPTAFREPGLFDSWREFGFAGGGLRPAPDRTGQVEWVSGAFMGFRADTARELGGFDEDFFLYAEDIEWCRRVRRSGRAVHYVAEASAVHEGRGSDASSGGMSLRAVAARILFHRKTAGAPAAFLLRAALTVNWVVLLVLVAPLLVLPAAPGRRARRVFPKLLHLVTRAGASRPREPFTALIAIVDFPNGVGGDTRRVHMIARSLVCAGVRTTLVIPCPRGLVTDEVNMRRADTIDGIDVVRLSRAGSYGHDPDMTAAGTLKLFHLRWASLFRSLGEIGRLRKRGLTNLFLYQPTFYDGLFYWLYARMTGLGLVADYCDLSFVEHDRIRMSPARRLWALNYRWGMTWIPKRLDTVFVISGYLERWMTPRIDGGRIVRLPPVVDADSFAVEPPPGYAEAHCGAGQGAVVLYAGSFFDNEGVPTLLRAAKDVLVTAPDTRFVIAGGHPAEAARALAELAGSLGITDAVIFTGVLPSLEMPYLFRCADILVAPKARNVLNEAGVPTKLVEYLASGRPVVASAVGDIPLIVEDETDGVLVPPDDPEALAGALAKLLADPDRRVRIGEAGRRKARLRYDVGAVGQLIRRNLPARQDPLRDTKFQGGSSA